MVGAIDETELVLRGGYLKSPVVATGLKVVGGKKYIYLTKNNRILSNFFTKGKLNKKPLSKSLMFERLAAARDAMFKELAKEVATGSVETVVATGRDLCEDLGIDEAPADGMGVDAKPAVAANCTPKKRIRKKARTVMPPAAEVALPRDGQSDLKVWVLMESASRAPAMEATQDNLQAMFDLVDNEISYGGVQRLRHGAGTSHMRPKPRGPMHAREYAVGRRWVVKIKPQAENATASSADAATSPSKPVRTLKKRRSDEMQAAQCRRRGAKAGGQQGDALDALGV